MPATSRLATILSADVIGYSHLLGADEKSTLILAAASRLAADRSGYPGLIKAGEEGVLERLKTIRREMVDPTIADHRGRILKTASDGMLVGFPGPVEAVRCAIEVQRAVAERNAKVVADRRITFRVGVNLSGVATAEAAAIGARLRALAQPGGVCVSRAVRELIRGKLPYAFEDIGEHRVDKTTAPVHAYAISRDGVGSSPSVTAPPPPAPVRGWMSPRGAVVAASIAITIGIWTAAGWAWLGGNLSTTPTRALVAANQAPSMKAPAGPASLAKAQAPSATPSIIVLPFANLSNNPDQEYFADGITEGLTADLSRIPGSLVVARNTAFSYKGNLVDAEQVARELDVRYVLAGGVRRDDEGVLLNAQMIDAQTGTMSWAEQFHTDRAGLAEVHKQIVVRVAQAFDLEPAEASAAGIEPSRGDPDARDLIMRGWAWSNRPYSAPTWLEAQHAFEQALEIDPGSVDARIGLARVLAGKLAEGWGSSAQQDPMRAERLLREVMERDATRSAAHFTMGVLRRMQNRLTEARSEFETTIALDPNDARALYHLGVTLMFLGYPEAGIPHIQNAVRRDPHDPNIATLYWALGTCHLLLGQADEAIEFLAKARAANSRLWFPHLYLAGAFGLRGNIDEARATLAQSIKLNPTVSSLSRMRAYNAWITNSDHWALQEKTLNVGLRRAGLPDD
jgi:TolB-like protein/class 3 adenylate cyclase/Tfp pilus assembly protein PilF